jgi:hypothetical protein
MIQATCKRAISCMSFNNVLSVAAVIIGMTTSDAPSMALLLLLA